MQDMIIFCLMLSPLHLSLMWRDDECEKKTMQAKAKLPKKITNISFQIGLGSDAEAVFSASGKYL